MKKPRPNFGSYNYVVAAGNDPLELQKRGIATTTIMAEWREERPDDQRLVRILHPIQGPRTPSFQSDGAIHLTTIGWRRVRALVRRDLESAIAAGTAPATLFSFDAYEQALLPMLQLVDQAAVAMGYEEDRGITFPYLILSPGLMTETDPMPLKRPTVTVNHQGAGHLCSQRSFHGIVLKPNAAALKLAEALNREFDDSSCSAPPSWPTAQTYQEILKAHGLDCNVGYVEMEESVYPINPEHVRALTDEKLPAKLDSLVDWAAYDAAWDAHLLAQGIKRNPRRKKFVWHPMVWWRLYLVTENSD